MDKINNSISFKGDMMITTWKKAEPKLTILKTTEGQDRLLQSFVRAKSIMNENVELSRKDSDFLHGLIEKFSGKKFHNTKGKKVVYDSGDSIHIRDYDSRLLGGVDVSVDF